MKIGILGSGDVGQKLGAGFARHGHEVMLGTRDPQAEKIQAWIRESGAQAGSFADTAAFGEMLILATQWTGTENALELAGREHFAGKVVLDATNPLDFSTGAPALSIGHTDSAGEQVQRWLPNAKVVKCYNTVGNALMIDPQLPGGPPDMFYCGNDDGAKKTVQDLLSSVGWNGIDLGGIESSRYLEPLAMVWIVHGFRTNTWGHAFKLLKP
ncbi:MAG: NAD(P)-binding domain-containing protein [Candidatus Eisenbacteria bacterium]|uniref:NAD(P)-binding domain-containing protein n=1 Tax=Eiseniibacteriota bacterium TaxID=2212470 RepID=A0A956LX04_UNCEI|nr:NAD(P)-binding domain-containing protein [Candidatus Eisenbacteria bacterium]